MLCNLQSDLLENPGTKLGDGSDIVWFIPWSSQECMQCLGIDCQSTPRCFWQQDWYLSQSAHPQHKPLSLPGGFFRSLQNPWAQSWSSQFSLLFLFLDFPSLLFCHLMSCSLWILLAVFLHLITPGEVLLMIGHCLSNARFALLHCKPSMGWCNVD